MNIRAPEIAAAWNDMTDAVRAYERTPQGYRHDQIEQLESAFEKLALLMRAVQP